jgi:hypothetical protein
MAFSATLTPDPSQDLGRLFRAYGSQTVYEAIGAAAVEACVTHLATRDQEPNKTGFPKFHFWERVARGTRQEVDSSGVSIVFPYPMRMKVNGGTIKPINARFLTIPMTAAAYGKRAREFSDLKFAVVPGIGRALVTSGPESVVMYRLVRKAVIPADPRALPTGEALLGAVRQALDEIDPGP